MNDILKSELNIYYKQIADGAVCPKKQKKAFLDEIKGEITDYIENFPESGIEDIISVFGSPAQISEGFVADIPQSEIRKKLSLKKIIIFILLAALLVWIVFAAVSYIDVHSEAHGYFTENILYIYNVRDGII